MNDGRSIEDVLFPRLAKLLMEIETGFQLPHITPPYSVGWICALPVEMAACKAMLDEVHSEPAISRSPTDQNSYTFGKIGHHNVVIACLPNGVYGTTSATTVAMDMISTFQSLRFGMMVGIAGGVPSEQADIRLGDVVVGKPANATGGVFQHDMGKLLQRGHLHTTGTLNKPPAILLTAMSKLQADHLLTESKVTEYLESMCAQLGDHWRRFKRPDLDSDRLFKSDYVHLDPDSETCSGCDKSNEYLRPLRSLSNSPQIHYGAIASGNQVVRDSITRDQLAQKGILCFEMEAAGLMDRFPCLVVRGICDYADSHKNKEWQGYAAATAAAVAKEILSVVH
ncbi:purine and uridine phosphorylase [Aspergillus pseudoustus]|uniref:Purine and uridine phosphorylase n=1 Tax=Aspergillus pseudoustus TaxID=1810923 RepID=A0ABR4JYZ7_9EURO